MIKFGFFLKHCCWRADWWATVLFLVLLWSTSVKR